MYNFTESGLTFNEMEVLDEIADRIEPWKKGDGDKDDYYSEKISDAASCILISTYKNWEWSQKLGYDFSDLDIVGEIKNIEQIASAMVNKLLYDEGGESYIISKFSDDDDDEEEDDEE